MAKFFYFIVLMLIFIALSGGVYWLYMQRMKLLHYIESLKNRIKVLEDRHDEDKAFEDKYKEATIKLETKIEQIKDLEDKLKENSKKLEELNILQEQNRVLKSALDTKDTIVTQLKEEMTQEFKNLSNDLLESKQKSMQEANKEQLKLLLEPFDKELKGFKEHIEKLNRSQSESISLLRGELIQIKDLNSSLSKEANALTKALKGDNKIQGNWGEFILEKALESYGLREGIEFKREQSFQNENSKLRADVVLYLPDNKHIVIDAKVSLKSYSDILKAKDEKEAKIAKNAHIVSIKRHIDTLASKQYHNLNALKAPEFTLMFIPIEAAYLMALEIDNSLYEYAFEKNVAVVTPTTLLTTLKTVSTLWKLANHDKNMAKLAQEAASMHDKFALFLEEFNQVENRLKQALNSYDIAKNRLTHGQGSLYGKIKNIGLLSGKSKKSLPKLES